MTPRRSPRSPRTQVALFAAVIALLGLPSTAVAQAMRTTDAPTLPARVDTDGDGLRDSDEAADTDNDGVVDALDADDDNDGVPTREERPGSRDRDTDHDGVPDHLDADDDGDGIDTRLERARDTSRDTDSDGLADHLDARDDRPADAPVLIAASAGTIAADIDGDGHPDVLTGPVAAPPASAPQHRRPTLLSIATAALGLGLVVARRRR